MLAFRALVSAWAVAAVPVGATVDGTGLDVEGARPVVVAFLGVDCPVAELYAGKLAALSAEYDLRGVAFLGLAPNGRDDDAALARFSAAHGLPFPFRRDPGARLAGLLGVTRTPTVVVLDERRAVRYRGRVDDQYAVGSRRAEPGRNDLAAALDDLLAGRPVGVAETEAAGCPIERPSPTRDVGVTYGRDVAPILDRRCVGCHRKGEAGPFPLTTYAETSGWAAAIAGAVADGRMPPWHAAPGHLRFANDARLTDSERSTILRWVDAGAPEGDPADLPLPIDRPEGWQTRPELVVSIPRPFPVPARGVVDYQFIEVDPGFRDDRWVKSAEIRPGNREVVHHATVYLRAPGSRDPLGVQQGEGGSYCLAAYTPGVAPFHLPDGMAKRIPAGWTLVFVIHYTPDGVAREDRTRLGLTFAEPRSVTREVATRLIQDPDLLIPPRATSHRVERSERIDRDALLLSLFPHMHMRGRSFRYEAVYPGGATETLLDVPRYDFEWQNVYTLAEPKRLPAGTVLRCVATYDNSRGNPANPDPDATVRLGPQAWDEMFNGYYDIAPAVPDRTGPRYGGALAAGLVGLAFGRVLRGRRLPRSKPQDGPPRISRPSESSGGAEPGSSRSMT